MTIDHLPGPARSSIDLKAAPEDVTDMIRAAGHLIGDHHNDEDRVYSYRGLLIKVKTWHEVHQIPITLPTDMTAHHTAEVFRFSGSVVGDDGKAIPLISHPDHLAVFVLGRCLTLGTDQDADLVKEIELGRWGCVEDTFRSFSNHRAAQALTGVGVRQVK
jgi:hypothetical protein